MNAIKKIVFSPSVLVLFDQAIFSGTNFLLTLFLAQKLDIKDNFLKEAIQMELKGMIQNQSILVISSYDKAEDHLFHSKNLANAFINQGRKILVIDATGHLGDKFDTTNYLNFSDSKYLSYTQSVFQNEIQDKMKNFDCLKQ